MTQPRAIVLRSAGTNCDLEMVRGFQLAGARTDLVHIDRLIADPARLEEFDIIGFAGGFSYGDDLGAGRVFAVKVRERLYPALREAANRGVAMLGVCNGFQALVQTGLLPGCAPGCWPVDAPPAQSVALAVNAGGRFIDDWARVEYDDNSPCIWTAGLNDFPDVARVLPLASGEGRFVAPDALVEALQRSGQAPVRYLDNLNGSRGSIAGICDPSGRIFGLMPHPDRYLDWANHPAWTSMEPGARKTDAPGLRLFRNAVDAVSSPLGTAR
jgi:phosphoribosylformylglycinamidine synthase